MSIFVKNSKEIKKVSVQEALKIEVDTTMYRALKVINPWECRNYEECRVRYKL